MYGIKALFVSLESVLNPVFLALVIMITVWPIPGKIASKGLPGWVALEITILLVVLMLGLVISTIFTSIVRLRADLPLYLAQAVAAVRPSESMTRNATPIKVLGKTRFGRHAH